MSCFLSTTYWVFLLHILHVKYGIKRPNSLSFFFIILASGWHKFNLSRLFSNSDPYISHEYHVTHVIYVFLSRP